LKTFNLFQFAGHFESIVELQEQQSLKTLTTLIEKGRNISEFT